MYLGILIFCSFQWGRCLLRLACWKYIPLTWETPWGQHPGATACEEVIIFPKSYFITAFFWHINSSTTKVFLCIIWNHYVLYRITAAYKWSQSWARWIYSTVMHHVSLRSIKFLPLTHRYSKKTLVLYIPNQSPGIFLFASLRATWSFFFLYSILLP
jgi:hypothetical protein